MGIESKVEFQNLKKALDLFPKNVQKNIVVGATRATAGFFRDEVRNTIGARPHPLVRTGNLQKSIGTMKRKAPANMVYFSVTPRQGGKNDGFYGRFLEFGTSKMKPYPFMRPTFDTKGENAIDAFFEYSKNRIPKEVEKAKNGRS